MVEIIKTFMTNEIVTNWIAPIITPLIATLISIGIAKLIQRKKDERKINDANQRFVNAIRPYIIQEISIMPEFICDIRNVVVQESGVKDKFVYSELDLRNRLIMDINESKYIDENNKEKLIKFAYNIFKTFDNKKTKIEIQSSDRTNNFNKIINMPIVVFLISVLLMILVDVLDKSNADLTENPIFAILFLLAFLTLCIFFVSMFVRIFESKVTTKKYNNLNKSYALSKKQKIGDNDKKE